MSTSSSEYPEWIDEDFFREILVESGNSDTISNVKLNAANKKGENYSSLMLRAEFDTKSCDRDMEKHSLIVKLDPLGITQDVMSQFNVFPKEIEVYEKLLPEFRRLYSEKTGEQIELSPKCLKSNHGDRGNMLVLEDLKPRGFKTADRLQGLDLEHSKLALQELAKFHAASAVYYQNENRNPSPHFDYGLYADHMRPILYEMYRKNIELMREISSNWKCQKVMHKFLDCYKEKMLDQVFNLVKKYRTDDHFIVLCHGDFWCNNVMFQYDGETPRKCLLLDFQLAHFNSPVFDLSYFIFTSVRKDLKLSQMDFFIHYYHKELSKNLIGLEYCLKIPSLSELHREFHEIGAFGLNSTYGTLCAVVAPPGMEADMNRLLGDDDESVQFRRNLFSNTYYVDALEQLIPYFERKGIF